MIEENWKTKLDQIGFLKEWQKDDLLQTQNKIYLLKTPFLITIHEEVVEEIYRSYNSHLEIGGVMLAAPTLKNGTKFLEVGRVVFLKNLSRTPQKSFYRPNFKKDLLNIWENNSKIDRKLYVPIWFHSHPAINTNNILQIQTLIATSEADQKFSLEKVKINEFDFLVPNALIVKTKIVGSQLIIGFYGGGITPTDFEQYIMELTGEGLGELWVNLSNWVKTHPNAKWLLLFLVAIIIILAFSHPKQVRKAVGGTLVAVLVFITQILPLTKHKTHKLPNYFDMLEKEQVTIQIPYYEDP